MNLDVYNEQLENLDNTTVALYGNASLNETAKISDQILKLVLAQDATIILDKLKNISKFLENFNFSESEYHDFFKNFLFFKNSSKKTLSFLQELEKIIKFLDKSESDLETHRLLFLKQNIRLEKLYDESLLLFNNLSLQIQAGNNKINELRKNSENLNLINQLDKKLFNLETNKAVLSQIFPQVKMIINNNNKFILEIENLIKNTIPAWKNNISLTLGLKNKEDLNLITSNKKQILTKIPPLENINIEKIKSANLEVANVSKNINLDNLPVKESEILLNEVIEQLH